MSTSGQDGGVQDRITIDGISQCTFVDGQLRIRVVHLSGQYEEFLCTFRPLIEWIGRVGEKTAVDKLVDHPMTMEVASGIVRELKSIQQKALKTTRIARKKSPSSVVRDSKPKRSNRRNETKATRKEPSAIRSVRKRRSSRSSLSSDSDTPSAGVRFCPSCQDVRNTVLSFEHGRRFYRCKRCGSITGYS